MFSEDEAKGSLQAGRLQGHPLKKTFLLFLGDPSHCLATKELRSVS